MDEIRDERLIETDDTVAPRLVANDSPALGDASARTRSPRRPSRDVVLTLLGLVSGVVVSAFFFVWAREDAEAADVEAAQQRTGIAEDQVVRLETSLALSERLLVTAEQNLRTTEEQLLEAQGARAEAESASAASQAAQAASESAQTASEQALLSAEAELVLAQQQLEVAITSRDTALDNLATTQSALDTANETLITTERVLSATDDLLAQVARETNLSSARFIQALIEGCPRDDGSPSLVKTITNAEYSTFKQRADDIAMRAFRGEDVSERVTDLFETLNEKCGGFLLLPGTFLPGDLLVDPDRFEDIVIAP